MKKILATIVAFVVVGSFAITGHAQMFKDISPTSSSYFEVNFLISKEVINGYSDGTFRPNALIQKQHIAKMLVEALELRTEGVENPNFKDVPTTAVYYKQIAAATQAGLFEKSEYFNPTEPITRAQMAQIIANGFELKRTVTEPIFVDVNDNTPNIDAIYALVENDITTGIKQADGKLAFDPNRQLTRLHFSAFLARAMTLRDMDLAMDSSRDYYYNTILSDGIERSLFYEIRPDQAWNVANFTDALELPTYQEQETDDYYVMNGLNENQTALYISKPLRIGSQALAKEKNNTEVTVLSTNMWTTVNGETERNLVLVEQKYANKNYIYHYYFKEGVGLVKQELMAIDDKDEFRQNMILMKEATAY
ncbi:hypothetical protein GCM10007425_10640 [Lysinibacillus alkalisoli]|uniref:SLH domain-containing protein n=1 Tax=Lysinibacillus alkalisoli TaxID=1911548 RepID=A0A917G1R4_9BACI|nr:S-layer homology domain-containing protein [Lysinibacillus alkalisoli]GGG18078.1 hypothetical protein GCM10007425_10640 [Lysinibacillus alkalisoli]